MKTPKFVVSRNVNNTSYYFKISKGEIWWIKDSKDANSYSSKYAAKKHIKTIDNIPEDVKVVELETISA